MIRFLLKLLIWLLRALLKSSDSLVIENLALRQQLAAYARCQKRPHVKPPERVFWAMLSKVWASWRSALIIVKPATVIAWHRRGLQRYWRWRSRKPGRPPIPHEHIDLIRRISSDHAEWGEDRIAEELALKLGVHHSMSTIRKYMVSRRKPRDGQTWRTFVKNHAKQIYACDFLTQHTALFTVVYIFVVMEIASRQVVLINATTSPSLAWVKQPRDSGSISGIEETAADNRVGHRTSGTWWRAARLSTRGVGVEAKQSFASTLVAGRDAMGWNVSLQVATARACRWSIHICPVHIDWWSQRDLLNASCNLDE